MRPRRAGRVLHSGEAEGDLTGVRRTDFALSDERFGQRPGRRLMEQIGDDRLSLQFGAVGARADGRDLLRRDSIADGVIDGPQRRVYHHARHDAGDFKVSVRVERLLLLVTQLHGFALTWMLSCSL